MTSVLNAAAAGYQVRGRVLPRWITELEALLCEQTGKSAAAFENELGFGLHGDGAELEHPGGGGKAKGDAPGLAEDAHEVAVGERLGCGEVDDAVGLVGDFGLG